MIFYFDLKIKYCIIIKESMSAFPALNVEFDFESDDETISIQSYSPKHIETKPITPFSNIGYKGTMPIGVIPPKIQTITPTELPYKTKHSKIVSAFNKEGLIKAVKNKWNAELDDVFIASRDKEKGDKGKGKYFYAFKSFQDFISISKFKSRNWNWYETIYETTPVKPYIDFDMKLTPEHNFEEELYNAYGELYEALDTYGNHLVNECNMSSYSAEQWFICEAHRHDKISFHAILNNGFFFENNQHQNHIINLLFKEHPQIDKIPYSKFQQLKLPYNSTLGKNNILTPTTDYRTDYDLFAGSYNKQNINLLSVDLPPEQQKINNPVPVINNTTNNVNIDIDDEDIKYLLSLISPDDFRTWLSVGMTLKNLGLSVDVWDTWSSKSSKYDSSVIQRYWNGFNSSNTIGTLIFYAKQNKDFRLPNSLKKHNIYLPNGWDTDFYSQQYLKPIPNGYNNIVIHSPMGSGKTTTIKEFISKLPEDTPIIYVSPRRTLSWDIDAELNEYGFINYLRKDFRKLQTNQLHRYITSFESFRFNPETIQNTVIIIDESKTAFQSLSSITMTKRTDMIEKINNIQTAITSCKQLICMDAYITPKTTEVINQLRSSMSSIYIKNNFKNYNEDVEVLHNNNVKTNFIQYVIKRANELNTLNMNKPDYLKKGIYIYCQSATVIFNDIIPIMEDIGVSFATICSKDAYKKHEREYLYERQLKLIQNPNDEWFKYEFIIGSPALSIGVNHDDKSKTLKFWKSLFDITDNSKHFIQRIAYLCSFSSNASDASQGLKRVRHTDGSNADKIFISTCPNLNKIDNDEFLPPIVEGTSDKEIERPDFIELAKRKILFKDTMGNNPTPDWLLIITAYDSIERKFSNISFLKQFEYYFKKYHNGNYTCEEAPEIENNKQTTEKEEITDFNDIEYGNYYYEKKNELIKYYGQYTEDIWKIYQKEKSWYKMTIRTKLLSNTPLIQDCFNIFQDKYNFIKPLYDDFKTFIGIDNIHTKKDVELESIKNWIITNQKKFDIVLPRKTRGGTMNLKAINHYINILGFVSIKGKKKQVNKKRQYIYTLQPIVENLNIN